MAAFSETTLDISRTVFTRFSKGTVPDQGGLLTGKDPTAINVADPLRIWIIQFAVILSTVELLSWALRKIRQPRVIAEILGGILLGPTALGRIPGFTQHIFPTASKSYLSLVANIGLVLFLFLVAMEINVDLIKRNARLSILTALGGIALPFGLGSAFSFALYKKFVDSNIKFTEFLLFVGVAFSITGFPVVCRILTELKMLDTNVGVVVLSAGVANALVAWTLLALSVTLVNASSGLTALWIFLICVSWTLFLLFPMQRVFTWLAHRTGSVENGPTLFYTMATLLLVFGSAFITDVIGVHAIFGAFLAGFVIPREGRLVIGLSKQLEGIVSIAFLPLYFTLSGLSTDLRLLNNGITWAYTISLVMLAYIGKFGGCTIAARICGCKWREASTIGAVMSCKGLLELIVLNVGLAAGILNQRVFSMFVLEALLLTFLVTPLVIKLNPPEHLSDSPVTGAITIWKHHDWRTHFTVVLDKMEHLPGIMTAARLLRPLALDAHNPDTLENSLGANMAPAPASSAQLTARPPIMHALRLIELSHCIRANKISSSAESLVSPDPLLNVFKAFSELNDMPVSTSLSIVPFDDLAAKVAEHAKRKHSHLVLVSWLPYTTPVTHVPGGDRVGDARVSIAPAATVGAANPFDMLFKPNLSGCSSPWAAHSHFVRGIFQRSSVDVALFMDRGLGHASSGHYVKQHILLPFLGGPDDRLALAMVVQCCGDPGTTAKIVRVKKGSPAIEEPQTPEPVYNTGRDRRIEIPVAAVPREHGLTLNSATVDSTDTVFGNTPTLTELQSDVADDIAWRQFASPPGLNASSTLPPASRAALLAGRVEFVELASPTPLHDMLAMAAAETDGAVRVSARPFLMVGRAAPGSRRSLARESHRAELRGLLGETGDVDYEVRRTMGDMAAVFCGVKESCRALVVVQAVGSLSAAD